MIAGADDIEDFTGPGLAIKHRLNGPGAQFAGEGGDFPGGFALARKPGQEIGFYRRRDSIACKLLHRQPHLFVRERLGGGNPGYEFFKHSQILGWGTGGSELKVRSGGR